MKNTKEIESSSVRAAPEAPVFVEELKALLGLKHTNTIRVMLRDGKIPQPDFRISQKSRYWHRASLRKCGILPPSLE
jgi:hypothetical protein